MILVLEIAAGIFLGLIALHYRVRVLQALSGAVLLVVALGLIALFWVGALYLSGSIKVPSWLGWLGLLVFAILVSFTAWFVSKYDARGSNSKQKTKTDKLP